MSRFTHSLTQPTLTKPNCVPGSVLEAGESAANKGLCSHGGHILEWCQMINKRFTAQWEKNEASYFTPGHKKAAGTKLVLLLQPTIK